MLSKKELLSKDFLKILNKVHNKVHYVYISLVILS